MTKHACAYRHMGPGETPPTPERCLAGPFDFPHLNRWLAIVSAVDTTETYVVHWEDTHWETTEMSCHLEAAYRTAWRRERNRALELEKNVRELAPQFTIEIRFTVGPWFETQEEDRDGIPLPISTARAWDCGWGDTEIDNAAAIAYMF